MRPVLVFDEDPSIRDTIGRQLSARGYETRPAQTSDEAMRITRAEGATLAGLLVNVDPPAIVPGWEIAKLAREMQPGIAIGYLSSAGHRDWAVLGVPNSVIINTASSHSDIPDLFYRLCARSTDIAEDIRKIVANITELSIPLHREREILHAHFQQTSNLIAFLAGPSHRFTFANDAYLRLVEREVVGKTVLEAFPEVIYQGFVEILDRVYITGEEFIGHGVDFNIDVDADTMKETTLDLIYRPIRDADDAICGIFVEGTDLTEARIARTKISTLQNQLIHTARVNAMGLLASALAHELNQPLAAISNFISAATITARNTNADIAVLDRLAEANKSTFRASDIIRRLRTMTVINSSAHEVTTLDTIIKDAIFIASVGRLNANVACDLKATGEVYVDAVQIQQVIINFLQNAFESSPSGLSDILITTTDRDGFVHCSVRDAGMGIAAEIVGRVFDSFTTSKAEGMGIGLALSKTIIETHGGAVTADNNPDIGATFSFSLPHSSTAIRFR